MSAHQDLPSHTRGRTPSPTSPVSLSPTQSRVQSPERTITNFERKYSLGDYFGEGGTSRTCYTDQEFSDIATLLKESNRHSWSRVPRIYTVLRLIDQLKALDSFLDLGLNDLWLPFNISQLPQSMSAHHRTRFLEQQNVVLTKVMNLGSFTAKKHTHFQKGEELPFTIKTKLGQGGFASVYEAFSPFSGRTYALKMFRRMKTNQREAQSFMTELQVLQRINHHHCVELVASYTDHKNFGLLMSPVADCNLSAYYALVPDNTENQNTLRTFFGCLAHALQFLHESKIRHRDIKPQNILVKGSEVYLTDFGISLDWEGLSRSTTTADSAKSYTYCAPEVANHEKRNSSSDIWALGCVFVEMLTVLNGYTVQALRERMISHSGRPRFFENLCVILEWVKMLSSQATKPDNEVAQWIREMVVRDSSARSTAQAIAISITRYSKRRTLGEVQASFCGECCSLNLDPEMSSDATSDDEDWGAPFDIDTATSLTSPLPATKVLDHNETPSQLSESIEVAMSIKDNIPQSEGMGKDMHYEDAPSYEEQSLVLVESVVIQTDSGQEDKTLQHDDHLRAVLNRKHKWLNRGQGMSVNSEFQQTLIKDVLEKHALWPLYEFDCNELPNIAPNDWETPKTLLVSIKSDLQFMELLRTKDQGLRQRFKTAELEDLVPIICFLLISGFDMNYRGSFSHTIPLPLTNVMNQAWKRLKEPNDVAKLLAGFGYDEKCYRGRLIDHPFWTAFMKGNMEMAEVILKLDQKVVNFQVRGELPVEYAVSKGKHDFLQLLLRYGSYPAKNHSLRDVKSPRLCSSAARLGHFGILKTLIEQGANVEEYGRLIRKNLSGKTPLHMAASRGDTEMVSYLLTKGADPSRKAASNHFPYIRQTPYDIAKQRGFEGAARVLKQAIADRKREKREA